MLRRRLMIGRRIWESGQPAISFKTGRNNASMLLQTIIERESCSQFRFAPPRNVHSLRRSPALATL